jgi:hypothetical protein
VRVDTLNRAEISKFPFVLVYDYDALSQLATSSAELAAELEEIVRHTNFYRLSPYPAYYVEPSKVFEEVQGPDPDATRVIRGRYIRYDLTSVSAGMEHAADFEHACMEAISYIFGEDLVSWNDQLRTEEGLHRFDAIAKISSNNDFGCRWYQTFGHAADPRRVAQARHRRGTEERSQVYGQKTRTTAARLEDVPSKPCRWHRGDGYVCRADDLVSSAVRTY